MTQPTEPSGRHGLRSGPVAMPPDTAPEPYPTEGITRLAEQIACAETTQEVSALLESLLVRNGALISLHTALSAGADWCGTRPEDSPDMAERLRRLAAQVDDLWTGLAQTTADLLGPQQHEFGRPARHHLEPDRHARRAQAATTPSPHRATLPASGGTDLPPVPPPPPPSPPRSTPSR